MAVLIDSEKKGNGFVSFLSPRGWEPEWSKIADADTIHNRPTEGTDVF